MAYGETKTHESFDRKHTVKLGSDRKFGFTFAAIFFILAVSPLLFVLKYRIAFIILSLLFAATASLEPQRLNRLNRAWNKFGLLLGKLFSPIILGVLFYGVFTPLGIILRFFKKDILSLSLNKSSDTYWLDSSKTKPSSMKDQF